MSGSSPSTPPHKRIAIVGCPGSGKSTLARFLSRTWELPHVELDSLFHQANWVPLEASLFRKVVAEHTPADGEWVVCGNYGSVAGDDMRTRAQCIIYLDMSRALTMKRVILRTLGRVARREELWNGNRERVTNMLHPKPEENIILWAFVKWKGYRERFRENMKDGSWKHAQVIHLQTPAAVQKFMEQVRNPGT